MNLRETHKRQSLHWMALAGMLGGLLLAMWHCYVVLVDSPSERLSSLQPFLRMILSVLFIGITHVTYGVIGASLVIALQRTLESVREQPYEQMRKALYYIGVAGGACTLFAIVKQNDSTNIFISLIAGLVLGLVTFLFQNAFIAKPGSSEQQQR